MEGGGLAPTVNVAMFEVPPPGAGFNTVTWAGPSAAMSAAVIEARSWVALSTVVARALPFQRTIEPARKLPPVTVKVKPPPPEVALLGEMELISGKGLPLAVSVTVFESPPPGEGLNTVIWAVPAVARSAAEIEACKA